LQNQQALLNDTNMQSAPAELMSDEPPARPPPSHGICENCGTLRLGAWCYACGQHEDTAHHSIRRLAVEAVEHLINTDGKVVRTLRLLFAHPGRLTRDYLAGHRAPQVAPLQLFFVTLVLFLFIADETVDVQFGTVTAQQRAALPGWVQAIMPLSDRIHAHGGDFLALLRQSSEIFGLLTVPLAATFLWGLYAGRHWRLYDHLIFALHSLSFQLVMLGIFVAVDFDGLETIVVIPMGAHLFVHLRGVYGGRVMVTLCRMAVLALATIIAYAALSVAWIAAAYVALTI
jgi:hypothetical protein